MAAPNGIIEYVQDQLRPWAPVSARRMFSGHGLFRGDTMFALLIRETLYFRTDEVNRGEYEEVGMKPFTYRRDGRAVALAYHEVPVDILDESDLLAGWAERAYAAAVRRAVERARPRRKAAAKKSGPKRKGKPR
jgi:DNA transformation protein and related proteins